MSHQSKKSIVNFRRSIGQVISSQARFAKKNPELNFAYFHSMDIWQKTESDLRRQIKKMKFRDKITHN